MGNVALTVLHPNNSYSSKSNGRARPLAFGDEKSTLRSIQRALFLLKKAGATKAEAWQIAEILSNHATAPLGAGRLESSIEDAFKSQQAAEQSLAMRVREWIEGLKRDTGVTFSATLCDTELGIVTKRDKSNRRVIFSRLVNEGVIEPTGKRAGQFRVVDTSETVIDWQNAEAGAGLPIKWPLNLENRFEVTPGSIVIVAGESNAGKTAFLLNVARLNMHRFPTFYFSSSNETNAMTLKKRIEAFGDTLDFWQPFTAISRAGDYQDVVRPDGVNLIDYLEVHTDFYEVGGKIADIAAKLNNGLAIIGLQKNPGASFGRGGAMTLDKASAYIGLHKGNVDQGEAHTLRFEKIKYPLVDFANSPIRFKLAGGHKFVEVTR